jgi:MFS transporter, BCD family, chlorophyll transporter
MLRKRIQLGLIHVAVAMTAVPIDSTLNRIMIKELAIAATVVALLVSFPYIFSPIQVAIGSFADKHPILGRRRTPYVILGLLLCVSGVALSPTAAFELGAGGLDGILLSLLAFGLWGMGYNLSAVSYFSLASELSGEKGRTRTISVMFFMMILSIILTAVAISRMVDPYTPEALFRAIYIVAGASLALGLVGTLGLEPRESTSAPVAPGEKRHSTVQVFRFLLGNRQAVLFFWYMILLLSAILGENVILEPFAAQAFGMAVGETTRITAIWGVFFMVALAVTSLFEKRFTKRTVVKGSSWGAMVAFLLLGVAGLLQSVPLFYVALVLLGTATGSATGSNLSLMLDMTTAGKVGMFIGAWGTASALARLSGAMIAGVVRDSVTQLANAPVGGYVAVFVIYAAMIAASLIILRKVDVGRFKQQAEPQPTLSERIAIVGDI